MPDTFCYQLRSDQTGTRGAFEYTTETAGFGLQEMQKRARDVAATLRIFSNPGLGTQVCVKVNVPNEKIQRRILTRAKQIFRKTLDDTNAK
jgi:signal transduction histidine kinase